MRIGEHSPLPASRGVGHEWLGPGLGPGVVPTEAVHFCQSSTQLPAHPKSPYWTCPEDCTWTASQCPQPVGLTLPMPPRSVQEVRVSMFHSITLVLKQLWNGDHGHRCPCGQASGGSAEGQSLTHRECQCPNPHTQRPGTCPLCLAPLGLEYRNCRRTSDLRGRTGTARTILAVPITHRVHRIETTLCGVRAMVETGRVQAHRC